MRALTVGGFGLAALALVGAAFLPFPWWAFALYAVPLCAVLGAAGGIGWLLDHFAGPLGRTLGAFPGLALALFAVSFAVFEGPPGGLGQGLTFEALGEKALSVVALAAAGGSLALALPALRSPVRGAQVAAALALSLAAGALGRTASALGAPFASPVALALLGLAGALYAAAAMPRQAAEPDEASGPHGEGE